MEFGAQLKKLRKEMHLSQEEMAEQIYVTRQTVSNWENEKSYPDIWNLLLISSTFHVSLDQLIKGDVEKMKETIDQKEVQKLQKYGRIYTILIVLTILSAFPFFLWMGFWAYIPWGILVVVMLYFSVKVERIKKKNDVQTYKEIIAFVEGRKLDEINKQQEIGKRPYQRIFLAIISALVAFAYCALVAGILYFMG